MCKPIKKSPKVSYKRAYFSSLTVNKRDKEIDVSVGDLRMAILIQVIAAEEFHWPVLRQKPSDTNITGILGG